MDFYSLLNKIETENDNEKCLISQDNLDENYITLDCNHKFNLLPLYNEVIKQKTVINTFEITHLKVNEIKCPYCREITSKLLPYIDISGINYTKGVNYPIKYCMKIHDCDWVIKTGKNKGCKCSNSAFKTEYGTFCNKHQCHIINKNTNNSLTNEEMIKYKKYTMVQLKQILKGLNLKISGNKQALIQRLLEVNYNFD
tara:strand:- start:1943 stop:2536 length:594 start_codon:yes stop_codon:yes gene_type:complete